MQSKSRNLFTLLSLLLVSALAMTGCVIEPVMSEADAMSSASPITEAEILEAQQAWGDGIVAIGDAFTNGEDYEAVAQNHLDTLYAYGEGTVLFKPTKAAEEQFRLSEADAFSYFVTGGIAEDTGFALQPWTAVRFENADLIMDGDSAVAMGNYFFTDGNTGNEAKVEYTFGYMRGADGQLLINVHHSAFPYQPAVKAITEAEILEAQQAWGDGIVAIGDAFTNGEDYEAVAQNHLDTLYAYAEGTVLFKPTKAAEEQFRLSEVDAFSYFVTGGIAEDTGFALQPWSAVQFENADIIIDGDSAVAMGNYFFTDANTGDAAKVEYTFGYTRGADGQLLINVHHSAFPYQP